MPALDELELKAVVDDPDALRRTLLAAGGVPGFRGTMEDRRLDRLGELSARDEVLRVRTFLPAALGTSGGTPRARIAWKGPTRRSPEGYKLRRELEYEVTAGPAALALFEALGYSVTLAIDRFIEVFELAGATLRLEWYPRMDVLFEVEGSPAAIEAAAAATGLPRARFLADDLAEFVARYEARTGRPAVLATAELPGVAQEWNRR